MTPKKGHFITFEGIDGSGKSTQISLLKQRIEQLGASCYETAEPSAGPIGTMLRQFLSGRMKADEQTLAALFAADRLDHLKNETNGICRKIDQGIHVLCDRYVLSNYAYQGVSAPIDWIMQLNLAANETIRPDCHIFIDVDPDVTMERMAKNRFHADLYETREQLTRIRDCYRKLIEQLSDTEHIVLVDGNSSIEQISEEIWQKTAPLFTDI